MSEEQETKVKTSITLSPYLFEWMTGLVKDKTFASNSDAITTALSEMKGRMEEKEASAEQNIQEGDFELLVHQLLDAHQDLVEEVNTLRRKQRGAVGNYKKVTFE